MTGDAMDSLCFGCGHGQQAECLHHGEGGTVAADLPYTKEKLTPGDCHTQSFAVAQLSPNVVLIDKLCQSKKRMRHGRPGGSAVFTIREKRQYAVPRGDNTLRP
jgi:hypothetical protein